MFKKDIVNRLNILKEEKVETLIKVCNPYALTLDKGFLLITPFGSHTYSFDVILNDKESFDKFLNDLEKEDIIDNISDSKITVDNVIKFYEISGFINVALLEDLKLLIKELLNDKH